MNMSEQIGTMSDRIVYTERMLANVSTACCHATAPHLHFLAPNSSKLPTLPPPHCNGTSAPNRSSLGAHDRSMLFGARVRAARACAPWDALCLAVKAMTVMAEQMEDTVYKMCSEMLNQTTAGALEIGRLADDIVGMEHQIIDTGLLIGQMSDDIVRVESAMLQYGKQFCQLEPNAQHESQDPPPAPPRQIHVHFDRVLSIIASVNRLQALSARTAALWQRSVLSLEDMDHAL